MSTDQAAIDRLAQAALPAYDVDPASTVTLINVSENWTYRIGEPGGRAFALRVHRPTYHTAEEIASELDWIDALREDGVVETAHAVAGRGGSRVCQVRTDDLGERNVVLFEWLAGEMPDADAHDLMPGFRTLGAVSARMHGHARGWAPPSGFERFRWDYATHRLTDSLTHFPLALLVLLTAFPLYWAVVASLTPEATLFRQPSLWPTHIILDHYRALFVERNFWVPIRNSLIVAGSTTLFCVVVGSLAAYALARLRFRGFLAHSAGEL